MKRLPENPTDAQIAKAKRYISNPVWSDRMKLRVREWLIDLKLNVKFSLREKAPDTHYCGNCGAEFGKPFFRVDFHEPEWRVECPYCFTAREVVEIGTR